MPPIERTRARRVDPDVTAGSLDEDQGAPWDGEDQADPVVDTAQRRSRREREQPSEPPRRRRSQQRESAMRQEEEGGGLAEFTKKREENAAPNGGDTVLPRIAKGRSEVAKLRANSDATIFFRWPEDGSVAVVKFIEPEYWAYNRHWLNRGVGKKSSFACIGRDNGCPFCQIGNTATPRMVYQVLNLSLDDPIVQGLEVGPQQFDELDAYDADPKVGPLGKGWWALSRSKLAKKVGYQQYNYMYKSVKDRDLDEDYEIDLDWAEDCVDTVKPLRSEQYFGSYSRKELMEIAKEVMGG